MEQPGHHWDVIVVGSGLGGLSCAAALAKGGVKVLVLEKHPMVGGYATQVTRKAGNGVEYCMDVSCHIVGGLREGSMFRGVLEQLGVLRDLNIKHLDKIGTLKLPIGGYSMTTPGHTMFRPRADTPVPGL